MQNEIIVDGKAFKHGMDSMSGAMFWYADENAMSVYATPAWEGLDAIPVSVMTNFGEYAEIEQTEIAFPSMDKNFWQNLPADYEQNAQFEAYVEIMRIELPKLLIAAALVTAK